MTPRTMASPERGRAVAAGGGGSVNRIIGLQGRASPLPGSGSRPAMRKLAEVSVAVEAPACGLARAAVVEALRREVAEPALGIARLLISELVGNAVRHARSSAEDVVVVRVWLGAHDIRLEVDDPGGGGAVLLRTPSVHAGGGLGLNVVESLSERWAVERVPGGRNRVWAEVALAPRTDSAPLAAMAGEDVLPLKSASVPRFQTNRTETNLTSDTTHRPSATVPEGSHPKDKQRDAASATAPPRQRGQAKLERAHKTVDGMVEAAPGAPRSGSA